MSLDKKGMLRGLRISKNVAIKVISALVISGSIGTATYAATIDKIVVEVDGKKKEVYTYASTVKDLLSDEEISVTKEDKVYPASSNKITDGMKVVIEKAKPFSIVIDGKEQKVYSTAKTVGELLKEKKIELRQYDKVYPAIHKALGSKQKVMIQRAFPVTLHGSDQSQQLWSTSTTVADFLKEHQVSLDEFDRVEPALEENVKANMAIKVIRVEKASDVLEEPIPFSEVKQEDASLSIGTEKMIQGGIAGKKKKTFEVIKENGKEISRNLQKEEIIQEAQNQKVAVGTKQEVMQEKVEGQKTETNEAKSEGEPPGREFYVEATAYSPNCGGCQGISAGGYNYKANPNMKLIAVDPSIIPLGTKVWVEGYGYAVAGDTGGAIKGHRIDLLMPTEAQVYSFGRKQVKIKVLQ